MKFKNPNKNNELVAIAKILIEKGVLTENEIKTKKQELKDVYIKAK